MSISSGGAAFQLQYQLSPIIMTGGVASGIIGGALPVLSIINGLLSGGDDLNSNFAFFQPLPGGSLIDQQIGMYPFANQQVAANATIQQPLAISMLMICPAGAGGGYQSRLAQMTAIQQSFDQHNKSGGLYTILTPAFAYTNCVFLTMTDVSSTATKQVQNAYKLDFLKPLVTQADAAAAQNALMSQITNGTPTDGSQTIPNNTLGSTAGVTGGTFLPVGGQGAMMAAPLTPFITN
jgi:hypothetical protein